MPGYKGVVPVGKPKKELHCSQCSLLLRRAMQTGEGDRISHSCWQEKKRGGVWLEVSWTINVPANEMRERYLSFYSAIQIVLLTGKYSCLRSSARWKQTVVCGRVNLQIWRYLYRLASNAYVTVHFPINRNISKSVVKSQTRRYQ